MQISHDQGIWENSVDKVDQLMSLVNTNPDILQHLNSWMDIYSLTSTSFRLEEVISAQQNTGWKKIFEG
jgi:hypothetical protein